MCPILINSKFNDCQHATQRGRHLRSDPVSPHLIEEADKVLLCFARVAVRAQRPDGGFEPGRNGPHQHRMTDARITGHWALTLLAAHRISRLAVFRDAALLAFKRLLSKDIFVKQSYFLHRVDARRDETNGLIGQAWSIEALAIGGHLLGEPRLLEAARGVATRQSFDDDLGLWQKSPPQGKPRLLEMTANQQAWFAGAVSLLNPPKDSVLGNRLTRFLDRADSNFRHRTSGRFNLRIRPVTWPDSAKKLLLDAYRHKTVERKESAYHAFHLVGLANVKSWCDLHSYWESTSFQSAIHFALQQIRSSQLAENPFGLTYNVNGFLFPSIVAAFHVRTPNRLDEAFSEQLSLFRRRLSHSSSNPDVDWVTFESRIYEYARYRLLYDPRVPNQIGQT